MTRKTLLLLCALLLASACSSESKGGGDAQDPTPDAGMDAEGDDNDAAPTPDAGEPDADEPDADEPDADEPPVLDGLQGHVVLEAEGNMGRFDAFFSDASMDGFASPAECAGDNFGWAEPTGQGGDASSPGFLACPDEAAGVVASVGGMAIGSDTTIFADNVAAFPIDFMGPWGETSARFPALPARPVLESGTRFEYLFEDEGGGVTLEWEAGDPDGEVWVLTDSLVDNQIVQGLFRFDDDGAATIPAEAYSSRTSGNDVEFSFKMWRAARRTIDLGGREVALEALASASGIVRVVEPRGEPLAAPITCAEADGASLLADGVYHGRATGTENLIDPGEVCILNGDVIGGFTSEGIWRLEVEAGQTVEATLSTFEAAPALYLLSDCASAQSCLVGASNGVLDEYTTSIAWTNDGAGTATVYLVIDGVSANTTLGAFVLEVSRD